MDILFFTKGDRTVGSSRLRVWQVAEKLNEQYGFDYHVIHSISHSSFSLRPSHFTFLFSLWHSLLVTRYSLLFVHKSLFPWDVVLVILAGRFLFRKRLIYDLDDAEWEHSFLKTWLLVKFAHVVFCGSHPILDWISLYTNKAHFIPTVVDARLYASFSVTHAVHDIGTIGWVGTGRNHFRAGNFAIIKPALDELVRRGISFRFVIVGAQNYQPLKDLFAESGFEIAFVDELDWADPASVPRAIQQYQFDVGIMPLTDTVFNRAKCAFKAIEYMACGVPTVASRVGEATYLIEGGVNGYLVNTAEEWTHALGTLLQNAALRKEIGEKAKQTIAERYSYKKIIPEIVHTINRL